jgi:hypothetical protein
LKRILSRFVPILLAMGGIGLAAEVRPGLTPGVSHSDGPTPTQDCVFIYWGHPGLTFDDEYQYWPRPEWWTGASQLGGHWLTNGWFVPALAPSNTGRLFIDVEPRSLPPGRAMELEVVLFDQSGATLYADLLDSNDVVLAADLYGNLMAGSNCVMRLSAEVPLDLLKSASSVCLRRGEGEVTVFETLLRVLDVPEYSGSRDQARERTRRSVEPESAQESPRRSEGASDALDLLGSSYPHSDSLESTNRMGSVGVSPGDAGAIRRGNIIYVNGLQGDDANTGSARVRVTGKEGPLKTVEAGLRSVGTVGTLVVESGHYGEDLNVAGRDVKVEIRGHVDLSGTCPADAVHSPEIQVPVTTNRFVPGH